MKVIRVLHLAFSPPLSTDGVKSSGLLSSVKTVMCVEISSNYIIIYVSLLAYERGPFITEFQLLVNRGSLNYSC